MNTDKSNEIRRIPIHRAMNRTTLILGAERHLVLFLGLLSFTLVFGTLSGPASIIGVSLWLFVYPLLRLMAKADPMMSKVYIRHMRYKQYYPAFSTPFYVD